MSFTYTPRSAESLIKRAAQKFDGAVFPEAARKFARGLQGNTVEPEQNNGAVLAGSRVKKSKQVCLCGHQRDQHCLEEPIQHWPASEGAYGFYFCLTEHCEALQKNGDPCDCWAFRENENDVPEMKRRKAHEFTLCQTCAHPKAHHCTQSRKKVVPGTYQGLMVGDDLIVCKHTLPGGAAYICTSASCAEADCACTKFRNPLLKKRARKLRIPKTPKALPGASFKPLIPPEDLRAANERYLQEQAAHVPKAKDRRAEILLEVVREDPNAYTVAQLAEAAERSPSWVRKHLRAAGITLAKAGRGSE